MKQRLLCLEKKIDKTRKGFYETGRSLKEIRDGRLYKAALFSRFELYTKDRFDIGKSKAYRLINACDVIDNLSPIGDRVPSNEAQVRPLTRFKKEEQQTIWSRFLTTGMEVNALEINKFIKKFLNPEPPAKSLPVDRISDSYQNAVMAMMEEIRAAQSDNWTSTFRHTALMWNRIMREKIEFSQETAAGGENGQ